MSEGRRAKFAAEGWLEVPGLASSGLCDEVRAALAPFFAAPDPPGRILNAWEVSPPVRALATHPAIVDLASHLLGTDAIAFQTLNFARGTEQAAHVDSLFFDTLPRGQMCGVWVALEPVGPSAGPLRLWPGSHLVPGPWPGCEPDIHADGEPLDLTAGTGDVIVWAANLRHGGAPVVDPARTRWSQVIHFVAADRVYVSPIGSEPEDERYLVRDQLVDIATQRPARQQWDGRPVRLAHGRGGLSRIVVDPTPAEVLRLSIRDVAHGWPSGRRLVAARARRAYRRRRHRPITS